MKIPFVKMHGCANDFVVVDARQGLPAVDWAKVAPRLLDRRLGIGGDTLLALLPAEDAEAAVRFVERDGGESEMCGNGIRCLAKLLLERGEASGRNLTFETPAGRKTVEALAHDRYRVDMGRPRFEPQEIPLASDRPVWGSELSVGGRKLRVYALSMGNPHAVTFVPKAGELDRVSGLGPLLENHALFPERTNAEFAFVRDRRNLDVRVWERRAGETHACGTGACAVAVAAIREQLADSPVTVHFRGGDVDVEWSAGESVFLTGPAEKVFEGEVEL